MRKTFLSLLITMFILSLASFGFAQPMEEEEEPIQARPSPIMNQKMNAVKTNQNNAQSGINKPGAELSKEDEDAQSITSPLMQQQKLSNKAKTNMKQIKGQIQTPAQQQQMNNAK